MFSCIRTLLNQKSLSNTAYLLGILTFFAVSACKTSGQSGAKAADLLQTKSLLWRVSGNGLKTPSYVYGTIHMIPRDSFFLTDATKRVLGESKRITFEINMKDMSNPLKLLGLMSKMNMKGGKKLSDLLSKEDYALVKEALGKRGMPMAMLERMKPMFLSSMIETGEGDDAQMGGITMSPTDDDKPKSKMTAYEMELMQIADKQKKEMAGLETMEFQMSIFDSIPYQAQAQMLVDAVKKKSEGSDEFAKMVQLYRTQDVQQMAKMSVQDDPNPADKNEMSQYENLLLNNRNRTWIPKMGKMMSEKPTFFAVGAGHLGGEKGVLRLLQLAGYKVEPLLQ